MKHASRTSKHASRTSSGFSDSKKSTFRNEKESVVKARLMFLATILAFPVVSPNINHVYAADRHRSTPRKAEAGPPAVRNCIRML
jgi:hypothetical protein